MSCVGNICFYFILIIIIIIFFNNFNDYFKNTKIENYTPSIIRYLPCNKSQNTTCQFPYTNNKLNKECNNDIYTYQYGNRKLMNPNKYIQLIKKVLNDLSTFNINVKSIPDTLLSEKDFTGDYEYITRFFNNKLNKLISDKNYLQQNGSWKYEYFYISNPTIYYYEVDNNNKYFNDLPNKFNLFKITYVLSNPLRSSYTSCIAFITQINDILEIQYTSIINDSEELPRNNLNILPSEALDFSFIDTIANQNFDQFGNPNLYSGINYITEYREGKPIYIKADIPDEFKEDSFVPQYLGPLFGNGICKYPPIYKDNKENSVIVNKPPLYNNN